jgi:hypothetical protein
MTKTMGYQDLAALFCDLHASPHFPFFPFFFPRSKCLSRQLLSSSSSLSLAGKSVAGKTVKPDDSRYIHLYARCYAALLPSILSSTMVQGTVRQAASY